MREFWCVLDIPASLALNNHAVISTQAHMYKHVLCHDTDTRGNNTGIPMQCEMMHTLQWWIIKVTLNHYCKLNLDAESNFVYTCRYGSQYKCNNQILDKICQHCAMVQCMIPEVS